ncbi:hypothetical protein ACNOYE_31085 [Nannocystaceae bacterium ST9]
MRIVEGILDRVEFAPRLIAQVVEPCPDPRVHGYAVQADLGRAVDFLEFAWLALIGELPTREQREALSRALIWLAPLHVGEGPSHAAVVARVAGAPDEVVPAIAGVALGQHVAQQCRTLAPWFAWLDQPSGSIPEIAIEADPTPEQIEAHAALAADSARWFGAALGLPLAPVLGRAAAAHALLHRLGVREPIVVQAFASVACLPIALAEAARTRPGAVLSYATRVPAYRYVEGVEEVE